MQFQPALEERRTESSINVGSSAQRPEETASSFSLVSYMQETFLKTQEGEEKSLHDRTIHLPFYDRLLRQKNISAEELLQHFVNNKAIFAKLESLIRIHIAFREVFSDEIFRETKAEEDIRFFMERFHLTRPEKTPTVKEFLDFVDSIESENPHLLLPILYVQYSGLFLGRMVAGATMHWLQGQIPGWSDLPQGMKGVSYWDFEGLPTIKELEPRKKILLQGIETLGKQFGMQERMRQIAGEAFLHNFKAISSVVPLIARERGSSAELRARVSTKLPESTENKRQAVVVVLFLFFVACVLERLTAQKFK